MVKLKLILIKDLDGFNYFIGKHIMYYITTNVTRIPILNNLSQWQNYYTSTDNRFKYQNSLYRDLINTKLYWTFIKR